MVFLFALVLWVFLVGWLLGFLGFVLFLFFGGGRGGEEGGGCLLGFLVVLGFFFLHSGV